MHTSFSILIDGGFVKRKLGSRAEPMKASDLVRLVDQVCASPYLRDHQLHRVYYYDASPLTEAVDKPLQGGKLNFGAQAIVQRSRQLFTELARIPFFSLRLGELAFRGWDIGSQALKVDAPEVSITSDNLRPNIEQKGVDMRIGLDIAALTLKHHIKVIVLVTGDSDFIPAMKFARREGAQLFLVPLGHGIREGMYEHADVVIDINPALPRASQQSALPAGLPA
ncbi:hypothetical protein OTERR_13120 [Oryzomicrobium terrae]|uniref:NYN domain-containing protein n=1 Tax=Oryzomicrobium terrae TaxID=1735038 RepID=A0A5C1E959_9RHOO|nr:NYN domain-containing protein [Oryzomicrobium terrae]QEL64788.1 hypothetical protein OTERR_13120 [Oryzomicrobium terrae]